MSSSDNESGGKKSAAGPIARATPYELVFTEGDFESRIFPMIRAEALEQGVESLNPERFEFLSVVGDVVRAITPEEAPPDAFEQYRALLFHAYNFWMSGRRMYALDPSAARYLVEAAPSLEGWSFKMPVDSAYLQLPANLFWSTIAPDTPPEPVDGFFLTRSEGRDRLDESFDELQVLMVLGIHRARAGFSVIPIDTALADDSVESWSESKRPEGDFANVLPGGELSGLYSILTWAEVLKLSARALWYIEQFPEAATEIQASEPRPDDHDPPPTHLAYIRIGLGEGTSVGEGPAP